jgi:DNA-binding MarR family transcriptional regulator
MPDARRIRELPALLAQAHQEVHGGLGRVLKPEGLPVEQWRILEALVDGEGRTMSALAGQVGMSLPRLSKTIDRMSTRAWVHRKRHPRDQRSVLVFISDFGLEALRRREADLQRFHDVLAERLGDRGTSQLARLLQALLSES